MVWSKIEPKTGRKKYIRRYGDSCFLTTEKRGAEAKIPPRWKVVTENGILKIKHLN